MNEDTKEELEDIIFFIRSLRSNIVMNHIKPKLVIKVLDLAILEADLDKIEKRLINNIIKK